MTDLMNQYQTVPHFEKGGLGGICGRMGNATFSNPPQSPFDKGGSAGVFCVSQSENLECRK
jgi:hypothetical protein